MSYEEDIRGVALTTQPETKCSQHITIFPCYVPFSTFSLVIPIHFLLVFWPDVYMILLHKMFQSFSLNVLAIWDN